MTLAHVMMWPQASLDSDMRCSTASTVCRWQLITAPAFQPSALKPWRAAQDCLLIACSFKKLCLG